MMPWYAPLLTMNPSEMLTRQVRHLSCFIRHLMETFDRILCATCCIQSLAQTLLNCGVEIIKFPSEYLSDSEWFR